MKTNITLGNFIDFNDLGTVQARFQEHFNPDYTREYEKFASGELDKSKVDILPDEDAINYISEYVSSNESLLDKAMCIKNEGCNNYWKDKDYGMNFIRLDHNGTLWLLHSIYKLNGTITDKDYFGDVCPNKTLMEEYKYLYDRVIVKFNRGKARLGYRKNISELCNFEVYQVLPEKY